MPENFGKVHSVASQPKKTLNPPLMSPGYYPFWAFRMYVKVLNLVEVYFMN